jgi:hypothetical protein
VNKKLLYNQKLGDEECSKAYFEGCEKATKHNNNTKDKDPRWKLIEKCDECNIRDKDTMLRYLDPKKENIDWYTTMRNLSSYGIRSGYSMSHHNRCIDRWVSYFAPNMRPVTDQMDQRIYCLVFKLATVALPINANPYIHNPTMKEHS